MSKIRVLIVDDSQLFREFMINALKKEPSIEVVGVAGDPYEARNQIIRLKPDVMTCDIEMPKMDGIEFVTKLIPQYPIPVIMISSLSDKVFDALNAGAIDFVAKPTLSAPSEMETFLKNELVPKILAAPFAKIRVYQPEPRLKQVSNQSSSTDNNIIAIGASTGGTEAIFEVVKAFDKNVPGIVITQHIPPVFSAMFAERLDKHCNIECREAKTGDIVRPGLVLVAPGDRQMRLVKVGDNFQVECKGEERVNGHCPSVDVLFDSVAKVAGDKAIGILLTGMGADGAKGLLKIRQNGGITIGQDKNTCVVYGMPMEAYRMGAVKYQLPLQEIPKKVISLLARTR